MLGFLNSPREGGPLAEVASADQFWTWLPRNEPFVAQKAVSDALAEFRTYPHPGRDQFRILLAIDQRLVPLSDALLQNYAIERVPSPSMEIESWESALKLSQSFAETYVYTLAYVRSAAAPRNLREFTPAVLLRIFQHRQIEFLLRPFLTERPTEDCWIEVHGAYRYAREQGLLHQHAVVTRNHEERRAVSTLEREYIHLLLLELMNRGQVSPYDAFWVNRSLPRWCAPLALKTADGPGLDPLPQDCLFVDQENPEGIVRTPKRSARARLCLDPAPMLDLIHSEIDTLRGRVDPAGAGSAVRDRRLKLLRKLSAIYAPRPAPFNRRGQRHPGTSNVDAIVGLANVIGMLRHERDRKHALAQAAAVSTVAATNDVQHASFATAGDVRPENAKPDSDTDFGVPHQVWILKDRSESGCRFRAQIGESNPVAPGSLVAIREGEAAPWTLVVVRRRRTRIGDRVDIGVEFLGRSPHGVSLAVDEPDDGSVDGKRARFNALYLPESERAPATPFKTLVLATRDFKVGRRLTLQSARATYTIRLKEPIEEQGEFAWLPYEVIERVENEQPLPAQHYDEPAPAMAAEESTEEPRADANSDALAELVTGNAEKRAAEG